MSVLFGTAITNEDKQILEWAKKRMENPQGGTVTAVPANDDILRRVEALEAKSEDKSKLDSDARVRIKSQILEETKRSRLQLRDALVKKMGEMSMKSEVEKLQKDMATTNATVLKNKAEIDNIKKKLKL